MIYLNNDSEVQQVYIPRQIVNTQAINTPELEGVATEDWVKSQGYTTEDWVRSQGYVTEDWVNNQGYTTETWVNEEYGSLKGIENTNFTLTSGNESEEINWDGREYQTYLATINGQSILGNKDITIEGGSGGESGSYMMYWPEDYQETVYNENMTIIDTIYYSYTGTERQTHNAMVVDAINSGIVKSVYLQVPREKYTGRQEGTTNYKEYQIWSYVPVQFRQKNTIIDSYTRIWGYYAFNEDTGDRTIVKIGFNFHDSGGAYKTVEDTFNLTSGGGGGEYPSNPTFNSVTVNGTARFNSEIVMASGGQSNDSDIASGIACAFKAGKSQSIDIWTRNIHSGTDGDDIYFMTSSAYYPQQLAKIDTEGNIYEGTTKLSDKYALKSEIGGGGSDVDLSNYYTKEETNDLIANLEIGDNGSIGDIVASEVSSQLTYNLKTINHESLVGEGNIEIDTESFVITVSGDYIITTDDLFEACTKLSQGKTVMGDFYEMGRFPLGGRLEGNNICWLYAYVPTGQGDTSGWNRISWNIDFDVNPLDTIVGPYNITHIANRRDIITIRGQFDTGLLDGDVYNAWDNSETYVELDWVGSDNQEYRAPLLLHKNYNDDSIIAQATIGSDLYTFTFNSLNWVAVMPVITPIGGGGNVDLDGYATEDWVEHSYVQKTEFDAVVGNINNILSSI